MAISLRKGKEIPQRKYSNEYKLVVSNTHGDNQANTFTTYYFTKGQLPILKDVLEITEGNTAEDEALMNNIQALQDKYPDSDLEALFQPDATDQSVYAKPTTGSLTWYDADGKPYKVTIKQV